MKHSTYIRRFITKMAVGFLFLGIGEKIANAAPLDKRYLIGYGVGLVIMFLFEGIDSLFASPASRRTPTTEG